MASEPQATQPRQTINQATHVSDLDISLLSNSHFFLTPIIRILTFLLVAVDIPCPS
jgi:hypothetical protein